MICDDVEVPNTCDTAPKRADLRSRLRELEYVIVPGGLQVFVGTPHTYYSIYADQPRPEIGEIQIALAGFRRLEVPLLDEQGQSRWPERFTPERIEAIRRRTGPAKFDSQMMLRPRSIIEGRLDPDRLRLYDTELNYTEGNREATLTLSDRRLVSASCWWDPSYGSPAKGDASVVAVVFTTIRAASGCIACGTCSMTPPGRMLSTRRPSSAGKWRRSPAICTCRLYHWKQTASVAFSPDCCVRSCERSPSPARSSKDPQAALRTCESSMHSMPFSPPAASPRIAASGRRPSSRRCESGGRAVAGATMASMR